MEKFTYHLRRVLSATVFFAMPLLSVAQEREVPLSVSGLKKLSVEELMNVEVTSVSKRSEKLTQAASAIQVITRDDIRQSGASNVPEALRLATNLQVAQVNASQWAISARGFNNVLANKLLVLIDGRVVYTPMYAGVFWDVQNLVLEDVERIEVISGPGGALWGANAVNGVINIITKSSTETTGIFAELAAGTLLRTQGSLRYGKKISDKLSFRVYGTAFKRGPTHFEDSVEANDGWKMATGGMQWDWLPTEKNVVTFQTNLYNGRPDPDGGSPIVARGTNLLSRWTHTVSPTSGFQVQLYYDQTWRDFGNEFTEQLKTYDLDAQHRFRLMRTQEIIYGVGVRAMDHEVENLELFGFFPGNKSLYLYNAFIQDEITLAEDRLRFTAGLKIEHNTYTGFQYQPSARLNWTPGARDAIWAAVSRAVRNPARIDREFFIYILPDLPLIAGSDFKSEEVLAYELGWRTQPRENLSIALSTFYNVYDNIRSAEPGPPPFGIPITFGNGVEGDTYGAELLATLQVNDWWRLRGGYTFFKKELAVKPGSADSNEASAESNDPTHQALLQSSMSIPGGIEVGAVLRYAGALPDPVVDEYVGLDLRVAWNMVKGFELSAVGQNLLQKGHVEFVPESPAPKDIRRSVYIKLAYRL